MLSARLGALHYRSRSTDAVDGRHPDTVAAELAISPVTILHSTSWRFVDGQVVLTYAAVLDGVPDPWSRRLLEHGIAASGDPASPSPPQVCPDAVATHAARHLAWLRGTDAVAGAALAGVPAVWAALDRFEPAPAGAAPLSQTAWRARQRDRLDGGSVRVHPA